MSLRSRVTPWIESLILSYDEQQEREGVQRERLKAHVIGVGRMSLSQARDVDGPTGLLFLSDGALQMPAVLTAPAWELLQENEDRECFSSLVNTTVSLRDYRLRFHMDPEQNKCRFYLSVGELATTAAGLVRHNPPCCTSLPSVRMKICRTWRALLGQEDSQRSQGELDLSELLGEWQNDCLQAVLEDMKKRLVTSPTPQASTSSHPVTCSTGWDRDRVRHKGEPRFIVPVECLLLPGEEAPQPEMGAPAALTGADSASDDDVQRQTPESGAVQTECWTGGETGQSSPLPLFNLKPDEKLLSNPWDMFSPPCTTSSSSDPSPEPTPTPPSFKSDIAAEATSTQLPVHSFLPPYQIHTTSLQTIPPSASAVSGPIPPGVAPTSPALDCAECDARGSYQKPKRKRCECTPEGGELSRSPPSWLFDSQLGPPESDGGHVSQKVTAVRKHCSVHSDGQPFSYSYSVSGQHLLDLSRFMVSGPLVRWALKYLLPNPDPPHHLSS